VLPVRLHIQLLAAAFLLLFSTAGIAQLKNLPDKDSIVNKELPEVVITGTMREISRPESPVPIEVYSNNFFRSNPAPNLFESIQYMNGIRPQLNCSVCNTGDIQINGMQGPYTMVLIDGMPIVSGLATVYGLSGIPQSLIERVEVVKGPASTLYGSEAVGGLINIITKKPGAAPVFSADIFSTSWAELNTDIAAKWKAGKKIQALTGINYFNYNLPIDKNMDGMTDMAIQNRISVFNKWDIERRNNRIFSIAARYVYEDRWGGDTRWKPAFRGGDSIYGESIYTNRWELFGTYQLPVKEDITFQFSANGHNQNSVYGNVTYLGKQYIGFGLLSWNKSIKKHQLLFGSSFRYTFYDDNTPATASLDLITNRPTQTYLPGIFAQDEIRFSDQHKLLLGVRYDYNSIHGSIFSPRLNYKWNSIDKKNILRVSVGNGYRIANVFTEDHASLTGARNVVFQEALKPETSWNGNITFTKKFYAGNGTFINLDAAAFYTYFDNKIIPDYDTDPNKIIYDNLDGYGVTRGASLNLDMTFDIGMKIMAGVTYMDVYNVENNIKTRQLFAENFSGVWNISYTIRSKGIIIDYTGNLYGPMRLPLLSPLDPRREYSPVWSIQNIQLTKKFNKGWEIYGGVKNLLNWTPNIGNPFLIARANDPFDKNVAFDADGNAMITPDNPFGLTFDPTYIYGPNQGLRVFLGVRWMVK
jgi:outer membrane receptor for ferrienterochelin and colicins